MPPENATANNETPQTTPPLGTPGNAPEARNPDGSLKDGLSSATPETTSSTQSTDPTKQTLLNKDQPGERSESEKKLEAKTGAPEKYEFKGLPEGLEVPEEVHTMFKEQGLSNDGAQKLVDFYVKKSQEAAQAPFEYWRKMNEDWLGKIKGDPEYKGDMKNVVSSVSKLVDSIGDPALAKEFREGMDLTGAGNHPAFVKFMYRLAQQLNEGTYVKPGNASPFGQRQPGSGEKPSAARALFPNLA